MAGIVPERILLNPSVSLATKGLIAVLSTRYNSGIGDMHTKRELAEISGLSIRQVEREVRWLVTRQYAFVFQRKDDRGQMVNCYTMSFDNMVNGEEGQDGEGANCAA